MIRRAAFAVAAALLAFTAVSTPAHADQLAVDDPLNDVRFSDSGASTSDPRVDITRLEIDHQARSLRIAITVAQVIPFDDPAWQSMEAYTVLQDPDTEASGFESLRLWGIVPDGDGGATGLMIKFTQDDVAECETAASLDEAAHQYVLTADSTCLRDVPRSIRVGASMGIDPNPTDDSFDIAFDQAPDDDLTAAVASSGSALVSRIAGQDRIATAIELSKDRFEDGQAGAAVLASSATFPDAIAGGPLAVAADGPLLLTPADHLDPRVAAELQRALAPGSDVVLMGGTGALGDGVLSAVRDLGFRPRRIAGANRFETAVAIADDIGDHALVLIADGRSFREGLIAGAAAAALGGVVVLTDGATLPPATDDFLAHDPTRHIAIGTAALAAPGAERVTAASVSELSQKVLDRLLPHVGTIAVAGDATFADALAGAPHLASLGGGLLLTSPTELSAPSAAELRERAGSLREVVLYGGTAAISSGVADAISAAVAG